MPSAASSPFIVFSRETIERPAAEQFLPLISHFKGATVGLCQAGKLFATT
jgi:hypothetical protein